MSRNEGHLQVDVMNDFRQERCEGFLSLIRLSRSLSRPPRSSRITGLACMTLKYTVLQLLLRSLQEIDYLLT